KKMKIRYKETLILAALSIPGAILSYIIVYNFESRLVILTGIVITLVVILTLAGLIVSRFDKKTEAGNINTMLRDFIDSVPVGVEIFDKDYNCLEINKAAEVLFNTTKEEHFSGSLKHLPKFQPGGKDSLEFLKDAGKEAYETGSARYEFMYHRADGTPLPVMEFCQRIMINGVAHLVTYIQDMTETYKQRELERLALEKNQVILDAAPIVCAIFDTDSNCEEVNKAVETIFNTTKSEYMNNFEKFLPKFQPNGKESMQQSIDYINQVLEKGSSIYEFMYQLKDGTPVPVEETARRVVYNDKEHVVCYTRDLREQKKLEQGSLLAKKLQVLAEQLRDYVHNQASAVSKSSASIEEMVANINSVTSTLTKNAHSVEELEKASDIGRAGLNGVADDIKEITRESESLLEINSVMANIASQTNLLSMNAAIEAAHAGEFGKGFAVVADEIRKLAENSSKQSKTISAVLKKIKGSIDKIIKSTSDVLNKFQTIDSGIKTVAENEYNILRAMEEQSQGSKEVLEAIDEVNKITQQVENAAMRISVSQTSKFANADGKKIILVVDDDAVHCTATKAILGTNYEIVIANSGFDALVLFSEGLVPDLILLDLIMPDMDGWATYERVKTLSDLHMVPIAFFTSSTNPQDKERALKLGAVDFIQKPANSELLQRVGKIVKAGGDL
ncbi:MAG: methyl-accepting chemotaxis protein, partial [Spirochaetes bacterium]|nr:methyl-accepting chemotaxis protein [Spirochaetota bacterium]